MYYKEDFEKVQKRMLAFWNQEIEDRVCISVPAPKKPGEVTSMFLNPDPDESPEKLLAYWTDPETILKNNIHRMENTFLGGDTLPIIFLNFGTSGHCNYFGAVPEYGHDTIWFDPVWDDLEQTFDTCWKPDILEKHLALADYLAKAGDGKFLVSMPDNCGTLDAMAHLYGTENLLMDMLADPDTVLSAIRMLNRGWLDSSEKFYQLLTPHTMQGGSHAWMHLWAPDGYSTCRLTSR